MAHRCMLNFLFKICPHASKIELCYKETAVGAAKKTVKDFLINKLCEFNACLSA